MEIYIIAAVSKNLVIGKDNKLPWNIKEDLAYFSKMTRGNVVVMGNETYRSLPNGPLPDRYNIIVTNNPLNYDSAVCTFTTLDNLPNIIQEKSGGRKVFIIGGESMFRYYLPYAAMLYITYIDKAYEGDRYFPCFSSFRCLSHSERYYSEAEKCHYQFLTYKKHNFPTMSNDMRYVTLLTKVLLNGKKRPDRTGTGTISTFGKQVRFDISETIPLLTTKFVPWKACIKELLWFLKGQTDARILQNQGVRIWDGNTSREFLDNRGLGHLPEGDIGCGYGFQWRHFSADYNTCKDSYNGQGFDQIAYIINELKTNPFSRRIFMTAWNAAAISQMALPPCHVSAQFYVEEDDGSRLLSCHMYQRSVDCFLGLPFNIFSYSVLTYILAKICDMKPKELIISTGDTHIYVDHVDAVKEQITRTPLVPCSIVVNDCIKDKSINDITIDDFEIVGYFHHGALKGKMSV